MTREFRKGGIGALMDEYERAGAELARVLDGMSEADFNLLRDTRTLDDDCRSIQTILAHVIRSGYGYANNIRRAFSLPYRDPDSQVPSLDESPVRLRQMLAYTAETLDGRWESTDMENMAVQIRSRWGPVYDLEQMLEHAIVHILRHRRQIEKFLTLVPPSD